MFDGMDGDADGRLGWLDVRKAMKRRSRFSLGFKREPDVNAMFSKLDADAGNTHCVTPRIQPALFEIVSVDVLEMCK